MADRLISRCSFQWYDERVDVFGTATFGIPSGRDDGCSLELILLVNIPRPAKARTGRDHQPRWSASTPILKCTSIERLQDLSDEATPESSAKRPALPRSKSKGRTCTHALITCSDAPRLQFLQSNDFDREHRDRRIETETRSKYLIELQRAVFREPCSDVRNQNPLHEGGWG